MRWERTVGRTRRTGLRRRRLTSRLESTNASASTATSNGEARWGAESGFTLTNVGLTDATQVTLVIRGLRDSERHELGDIPHGESATAHSTAATEWVEENKDSMPLSPPYFVHWSSLLGVAEQREIPARTLFMLPDDYPD